MLPPMKIPTPELRVGRLRPTLLFLMGTVAVVCAAAREMTPLDVARQRWVTAAALCPDGANLGYVLAVPRRPFVEEDGPAWQELHVMGPNGRSRPFVTGPVNVLDVRWHPDGRHLTFRQKRSGDKSTSLYAIAVDGGEARRVFTHEIDIGAYDWSPDGLKIAFLGREKLPPTQTADREKGFRAEVFEEDWRPVKVWLAQPRFATDPWVESAGLEPQLLDLPGSAHAVKWSPDGRWLAVSLAPTPGVDDTLMRQRLHVVDSGSGAVVRQVETPGKLGVFRWSPDSEWLAMAGTTDVHDPREGRLLVTHREAGEVRELVPDYQGHFWQFEWIDPESILALGQVGVWSELTVVGREGGRRSVFEPGQHVISSVSVARDSRRLLLIMDSPTHPAELFESSLDNPALERLTDSNPWLAEVKLAPQEIVRYEARDGLELEGLLIPPLHREPGRRYPLILVVHGGPEAHFANGWLTSYSLLGQVAAARGFAVYYPNYRGSTGRGVEFSMLGQGDYAGAEFDDLVDAAKHLTESGLADPARVGVTGGSYGGYATAWCATALSEHFAAGVMFVGISDQISKFGTTDIPNEMYLVHARKYPWEDWAWFLERSPIRHAENGRTPLLILHGKEDTRVHPSQSMELFRYLKTLGRTPVRLVNYPGEGHGNRNAAARLDYQLRALRWFEHYLQGPRGNPPAHELDWAPYRPSP